MNDQMEQVWRSKDGKCTGSKKEVEAYLASRSPLAGMDFPYRPTPADYVCRSTQEKHQPVYAAGEELAAFVAFGNLAPLIEELLTQKDKQYFRWRGVKSTPDSENGAAQELAIAFEKACQLVPR